MTIMRERKVRFLQRLNLPFTGIPSFCRLPVVTDFEELDVDVAIVGIPYDLGCQYRSGARMGPRAVRNASTLYSLVDVGYYDHELDEYLLKGVRMVDCGDSDIIHGDPRQCLDNAETMIRKILAKGAMPVVIGGDHAITIPVLRAYEGQDPFVLVQLDAHLDFVDIRHGVTEGHGSPIRRASEMKHISGIAQLGIRGPGSSRHEDFDSARDHGCILFGVRQFREQGLENVLAQIPKSERYYVTMDCDALDPSLAPGTGTPSPGGFDYYEVVDILRGIARMGDVVGFDFVEVAPQYDPTEVTPQVASRIILDFLGAIFLEKQRREC
ncbi:MAG: agmatinase [Bacillota bacterium]